MLGLGGTAHQEVMYGLGTAYQVMWGCASGDVWSGDCTFSLPWDWCFGLQFYSTLLLVALINYT